MKILHFADVHLGMTNFGTIDNATGLHARILEFLDALDCIVDAVRMSDPDLVLFAGDAFRTRSPNPTLVTHFASRIVKMAEVCPVVMVVGNHDRQRGGAEKKHSISSLDMMKAVNQVVVVDDIRYIQIAGCNLYCLPWTYELSYDDIDSQFCAAYDEGDESLPDICVAHCTVEGATTGSYGFTADFGKNLVLPKEFFHGLDYVSLGHIHKYQVLDDDPLIVYSGSIERVDWGERKDDKGFVIADVSKGKAVHQFYSLQPRPMVEINVKSRDIGKIREIDTNGAIVRLTVSASRKESVAKLRDKAFRALGDDHYLLDSIAINVPVAERPHSDVRVSGMSDMDMLETYILDRLKGEDKDFIDDVLDAGEDIIKECGGSI